MLGWLFDWLCEQGVHGSERLRWGYRRGCNECLRARWKRKPPPGAGGFIPW